MSKTGDGRRPIERVEQAQSIIRIVEVLLYGDNDADGWHDEIRFALGAARTLLEDVGDVLVDQDFEERKVQS